MKLKLLSAMTVASLVTMGLSTVSHAEDAYSIDASVSIANMYLWRGTDLGKGAPALSGDLVLSAGGAYGGIWGSSGDTVNGTEYDLFVGYGMDMGDFNMDISAWTYAYPSIAEPSTLNRPSKLSEVILTLGYKDAVSLSYYDNVAGGNGYTYTTLTGNMGQFSSTLGYSNAGSSKKEYTHLDVGYAYNDNLSFKVSKVIDQSFPAGSEVKDNLLFVVGYSLPLSF
jgi:hypothetical protein